MVRPLTLIMREVATKRLCCGPPQTNRRLTTLFSGQPLTRRRFPEAYMISVGPQQYITLIPSSSFWLTRRAQDLEHSVLLSLALIPPRIFTRKSGVLPGPIQNQGFAAAAATFLVHEDATSGKLQGLSWCWSPQVELICQHCSTRPHSTRHRRARCSCRCQPSLCCGS